MNRVVCMLAVLGLMSPLAMAQNQTSPEQLQKMYENTLELLRNAQDRKNELAVENQKLQKKLADAEVLQQQQAVRSDALEGRLYALQQFEARWRQFLEGNPRVGELWGWYVATPVQRDLGTDILGDGRWPFGLD
ncbi:MAG: hypothetical protein H7144_14990 [Burkholderiales bacterium]|nr:hypothetical protein [Phycisphaerae bacterium]